MGCCKTKRIICCHSDYYGNCKVRKCDQQEVLKKEYQAAKVLIEALQEIHGGCENPNLDTNCDCKNCVFSNRSDCGKLFLDCWHDELKKRFEGNRLQFLGKSIMEGLAFADVAVFVDDWEKYDGCRCEQFIAAQYGVKCIYYNSWI